jgi:predicted MFS family arabinose efflux permease
MQKESPARTSVRGEIDWALFGPLLAHVVVTHVVVGVLRVTTSYRAIELGLSPFWIGVIAAGFAILPIFLAVTIGRYIDRGHDAQAAWIGSALMLVAALGLRFWPISAGNLLLFTIILGTGHMFLMAAQQMMTLRAATVQGRDAAFGHFMVTVSLGQGLGPFIVGWIGGGATVPTTGPLFILGLIAATICLGLSFTLRPLPREALPPQAGEAIPVLTLVRLPGMMAVLLASVVTVTAGDLLVVYMPLLGAERQIDASHIGLLLLTRSLAGLVARAFYAWLIHEVGRMPLTLISTFTAAAAYVLMLVPILPVMYVASVIIGAGLGVALTLTISGIVELAPPAARGTAMTLRITGNRIGLMFMPLAAGFIAAMTGVGGVLLIVAASLAGSAFAMARSRRP